ncbi:MAG: ATPase, T2SS/T4P/T4SS family [Promethearchaeota archaeon]
MKIRTIKAISMVCPFHLSKDGLDAESLIFCCDLCSYEGKSKGDITSSQFCRYQFLQALPFIEKYYPCRFHTNKMIVTIPISSMKVLKEFASTIHEYDKRFPEIFIQYPDIRKKLFSDPFAAYKTLCAFYRASKKRVVHEFISALEHTNLLTQAKAQFGDISSLNQSILFENLLQITKKPIEYVQSIDLEGKLNSISQYDIGPFNIQVLENPRFPIEKIYRVVVALDQILSPHIVQHLFTQYQQISSIEVRLQSLEELLNSKISNYQNYLNSHFQELTELEQKNLAIYVTAQSLNVTKTMPLLLDDDVQEIYLDKPGSVYYLDHAKWGRCKTNLVPSYSELSHIITRLRLESRKPLDERMPSLKTELKTNLFHVRAAIDIPPLAHEGPHLNIRKLRMRILTLPELITNRTISLSAATFLILCLTLRTNMTICGEPSTGKTTLANAINLISPPSWRRIAIEDALESVTIDEWGRHKVIFKVDPFDSLDKSRSTKSDEIIRLLHRSPDWVFLGELQTAEHSSAMFHAISAGIRGIQTCHANSNSDLLLRWRIHHNIPEVCFQGLGLLIHMTKEVSQGQIIRRVAQISEVKFHSDTTALITLFEWDKTSGQLVQKIDNLITPLISRTCKFQSISEQDIRKRFETYKQTLAELISNGEYNPSVIVSTFDKIHGNLMINRYNTPSIPGKNQHCREEGNGLHQISR